MKAFSFLLALLTLAGCSADDLTGPDTATDNVPLSAQASRDTDHADFAADPFSIDGRWQASDRRGGITLFLSGASSRNPDAIEGRGVIRDSVNRTLTVALEGLYRERDIAIVLLDSSGETFAKGQGSFSTDRSAFKMVLLYNNGSERPLEFVRR